MNRSGLDIDLAVVDAVGGLGFDRQYILSSLRQGARNVVSRVIASSVVKILSPSCFCGFCETVYACVVYVSIHALSGVEKAGAFKLDGKVEIRG